MLGYNGKIAYINLSSSNIEIKDLDPKIAEDYIGGANLSAKLTNDLLSDADYKTLKTDPYAEINPVIFSTGPLTGTAIPSSSRYCVTGISPLTRIWGESTSGGYFPIALRKSGYDALVIVGKSDTPKYISIIEGKIEIKDATSIWGKNTRETIDLIRKGESDDKIRIACIGKGGENLVRYACVINDEGRAAGRCGLGALLGSKKLKAIAVRGKSTIEVNDKAELIKNAKNARQTTENAFSSLFFSNHGTLCYGDMGMVVGDIPANYFTSSEFITENLTGKALKEQYPVISYGCAGCTIKCGRTTIIEEDGKEIEIDGPEYETMAAFGPMNGIFHFGPVLKANHICNLEGVDTISSGVSISFLIYLVENQIAINEISMNLSEIQVDDLRWGNEEVVIKLLNKIINREGIGNLLAEGVRIMAEKLGVDPELAAHVKGLEIPMHDPRAYAGQALSYATCCVGANHEKGDFFNIDGEAASFIAVRKGDRFDINGRETSVILLQDLMSILDSAVVCNFPHIKFNIVAKIFEASTGISSFKNKKKLIMTGERGTNVKRVISCKLGLTREDDKLPKHVTTALKSGA